MSEAIHDIFVIGGGINGCGIARDAVGRGYTVALAEMNDFASGTSSGATKLIHGGLRYLEHYEFRLVREALAEREVLLAKAPHIVKPMRFILPHRPHLDRLAEASGLDRRTIINIEGGHHPPKLSTVHAIAHALGVPLGVLVQVVCEGEDLPSNS